MIIYVKQNSKNFLIAYLFYYISLLMLIINFYGASTIRQILVIISSVLLFTDILSKKFKKFIIHKNQLLLVLMILIILAVSILLQDFFIIALLLFGLDADSVDFDSILRLTLILLIISTISVILLCAFGALDNVKTMRVGDTNPRYGWGFKHSNVLPLILVYCIAYYCTYKKKVTLYLLVFFQIMGICIYLLCHSRNALISLELLLILFLIYNILGRYNKYLECYTKICTFIAKYIYFFLATASLLLLSLYSNGNLIAIMIDKVLTGRLRLANIFFKSNPLSLFAVGTYNDFASKHVPLDNGYFYIFARYGILYMILLAWLTTLMVRKMVSDKNIIGIICILVLAATNFIDNSFLSYGFYPYLILALISLNQQYKKQTLRAVKG